MDNDSVLNSIKAAFNLGVWMRQNEPAMSTSDAGRSLGETIRLNIRQPEEGQHAADVIEANVAYLTDIALLGYLMSGVCSYDQEIKEKIPYLIEKRLINESYIDAPSDYEGKVADSDGGNYYVRPKAVGMN
jgi:hypothetical protein